jgi:3-hydroxyacyl-CoA dehydrogenase
MFVFRAGVVGAGAIGSEIARVIADAGIPVVLEDVDQASGYESFGDVDFVIEAVPESIETKQRVFSELDEVTPGHAILASNTSSVSITEIALATSRPDQVVGFHFLHPASATRLIEVVEGDETSVETVQAAVSFAQALRKTAIRCGDAPGFVVERILNSSACELWRAQEETGMGVEGIDRIVTESKAAPVGPFYRCDLLGLDATVHVAEYLRESYGDRFYVHAGMRRLVAEGKLGAKTGEGFYEHRR